MKLMVARSEDCYISLKNYFGIFVTGTCTRLQYKITVYNSSMIVTISTILHKILIHFKGKVVKDHLTMVKEECAHNSLED